MSKIQKLHHFLNQNIVAKISLYALAMVVPFINGLFYLDALGTNPFNVDLFTLNPYSFNWIGFYSCVLLIWAYRKKSPTLVAAIVLLNLGPIGFWGLFALMGGWLGILSYLSMFTIPFQIMVLVESLIVRRIIMVIGVIILAVILILAVRVFIKSLDANMQQPGYVIGENIAPEREQNRAKIRAEIEQNIVPCAKTKEEFRCFLVDTLGMKETPISESERTEAKAQFILELRRDLLPTQGNGNPDNPMAQFLEARKVPLEQTGFEITKYAMEYYVDDYKLSDVTVFLEENSFTYYASGESYVRNDEDDRIARHLYDNIALFRGVTAEDIDTKSEWYNIYVSLLTGHTLEEAK